MDPKPLRPVRDPFKRESELTDLEEGSISRQPARLVSNRTQLQPLTAREARRGLLLGRGVGGGAVLWTREARRGSELAEQLEAESDPVGP